MRIEFAPSARRFLDSQPDQVRSKLINDVAWLREHPFLTPDDPSKVPFQASASVVLTTYHDEFHWIIYYLGDAETPVHLGGPDLIVANIGNQREQPTVYRTP